MMLETLGGVSQMSQQHAIQDRIRNIQIVSDQSESRKISQDRNLQQKMEFRISLLNEQGNKYSALSDLLTDLYEQFGALISSTVSNAELSKTQLHDISLKVQLMMQAMESSDFSGAITLGNGVKNLSDLYAGSSTPKSNIVQYLDNHGDWTGDFGITSFDTYAPLHSNMDQLAPSIHSPFCRTIVGLYHATQSMMEQKNLSSKQKECFLDTLRKYSNAAMQNVLESSQHVGTMMSIISHETSKLQSQCVALSASYEAAIQNKPLEDTQSAVNQYRALQYTHTMLNMETNSLKLYIQMLQDAVRG